MEGRWGRLEGGGVEIRDYDERDENRFVPARASHGRAIVGPRAEAETGAGPARDTGRQLPWRWRYETEDPGVPPAVGRPGVCEFRDEGLHRVALGRARRLAVCTRRA